MNVFDEDFEELPEGHRVSKDVAIAEVKELVEYHTSAPIPLKDVDDKYPNIVFSIQLGNLTIDEDQQPTLKLRVPIKNENGAVALSEIQFRTRITYQDKKRFQEGLNPQKDSFDIGLRAMAFCIEQPKNMLDKFAKPDIKVIEQLCSLFF